MRIGIFGGSFDPPHMGHKKLGDFLLKELQLDKLIILPAALSPFKETTHIKDADRMEICRLTFPGEQYEILDFEIKKGGVSFSFDTLTCFREKYPEDEIFFVIGEDQLLMFRKWYRYEDILKLVTLVAVRRNPETDQKELRAWADENLREKGNCLILDFEPFPVSSTEIREKAEKAGDIRGLVSEDVEAYIFTHALYAEKSVKEMVADVRSRLSDYRFYHSMCVANSARELALQYGADQKKAYIAGILHDVCKELKRKESLSYFEENGVTLTPLEREVKKLHHAIAGAHYIREKYDLPEDIVSAVRYHTTGREDMTLLEKILFVADFISEDRDYPGVEDMRARAKISLEYAMEEGLRFTIQDLARENKPIHPDTVACYNQILLFAAKPQKECEM